MRPLIIMGAGGHARVLADALARAGRTVIGCVAPEAPRISLPGIVFLGMDSVISNYSANNVSLVNGIGAVGNVDVRMSVFNRYAQAGYSFETVVHPSAIIGADVQLSEGVQLMAGVILQTGSRIGKNSIINTGARVDHDCDIGAHVHIAPGAVLSGGVKVGERSHVGTGASVRQGIEIGAGAIIGVGAGVVSDIPPGCVAVGVPAKCIRKDLK